MKYNFLKIGSYKRTIEKQEKTIKHLAKSVAEGWCENEKLRAKIVILERAKGEKNACLQGR